MPAAGLTVVAAAGLLTVTDPWVRAATRSPNNPPPPLAVLVAAALAADALKSARACGALRAQR